MFIVVGLFFIINSLAWSGESPTQVFDRILSDPTLQDLKSLKASCTQMNHVNLVIPAEKFPLVVKKIEENDIVLLRSLLIVLRLGCAEGELNEEILDWLGRVAALRNPALLLKIFESEDVDSLTLRSIAIWKRFTSDECPMNTNCGKATVEFYAKKRSGFLALCPIDSNTKPQVTRTKLETVEKKTELCQKFTGFIPGK